MIGAVLIPSGVDALTFTPERIDSTVYPGVPYIEELTLFNETGESTSVVLEPVSLDIIDSTSGQFSFLLDSAGDPSLSWLSVTPDQFVLGSGEKQTVTIEVLAPDTSSGSLTAGLAATFRPVSGGEQGDINIIGVTGPYIFAEVVSEDSVRQGFIESFRPMGGSKWVSSQPVPLSVSFANNGNVHLKPFGTIEVRDIFGRIIDEVIINEEQRTVLAKTSRTYEATWGIQAEEHTSGLQRELQRPLIGPFRLTVEMTYGDDVKQSAQITMWAIPWRSLLLLSVSLVGVVAVKRRLRRV
jgi:hypothetical protein